MTCFLFLLLSLFLGCLVGCGGGTWSSSWGADDVVLVHNGIGGTILTNLTVNGVSPYGNSGYKPALVTGQEIQVPIRYASMGNTIELKFDVLDTDYNPLGVARTRIYLGRYGGYGPYSRGESPEMWYIRRFEKFVPLERAGR